MKNPIDDLFAKGLNTYEQAPSPRAFDAISTRLQPAKRKPLVPLWGRYAVAASVLLAAVSFWWINSDTLPAQNTIAKKTEVKSPVYVSPEKPSDKTIPTNVPSKKAPSIAPPFVSEHTAQTAKNLQRPVTIQVIQPEKAIVPTPIVLPPVQEAVAQTPLQTVPQTVTPEVVVPEPSVVAKIPTEQTFTVAVLEETEPTPDVSTPKKEKLFKRLLKGVQTIREGEWEEAGLDRRSLLAKAEAAFGRKNK